MPSLDAGERYLLETDGERALAPLHALVIDHVLTHDGPAVWVDAAGRAVTAELRDLAPDDRVLQRIHVARGFTPYQHTTQVRRLADWIRERSPSLVVLPAFDSQYRSDDVRGGTGRDFLLAALADVAQATRQTDAPVLLTRLRDDGFAAPVAAFCTRTLTCRETPHGPRFTGDGVETTVYRLGGGWVQTTLAFWRDVLAARQPLYDDAAPTTGVARGTN